jgi:hypothetical protein
MNNKIKIFYITLLFILSIKVVTTLFSNGLSVHHGKKIAQLQVQKSNLLQQQMVLNGELSTKSSLASITDNYDVSEFIAISNPLILNTTTTVASN